MRRLLGTLTVWDLTKQTYEYVSEHELPLRAAGIAFSVMFAGFPFLFLLFTIGKLLLPQFTGQGANVVGTLTADQIQTLLHQILPDSFSKLASEVLDWVLQRPPLQMISVNLVVTVWSASSLQASIIGCLNKIYGVVETRPYWRVRLQAAYMTFVQLAVLLAAVAAFMEGPTMLALLHLDTVSDSVADSVKWLFVFIVLLFSFGFTFHMGPDAKRRTHVTPGSVFGAFSFVVMAWSLRYYFTYWARFDVVYGPMFMIVAPLFWLWMNCLVLLVAAEINRIVQFTAENRHLPRENCPTHVCPDAPVKTAVEKSDKQVESPPPVNPGGDHDESMVPHMVPDESKPDRRD